MQAEACAWMRAHRRTNSCARTCDCMTARMYACMHTVRRVCLYVCALGDGSCAGAQGARPVARRSDCFHGYQPAPALLGLVSTWPTSRLHMAGCQFLAACFTIHPAGPDSNAPFAQSMQPGVGSTAPHAFSHDSVLEACAFIL